MAGIIIALSNAGLPHRFRFADGTTLKDSAGKSARLPPHHMMFSLFRWWLRKEAWRESGNDRAQQHDATDGAVQGAGAHPPDIPDPKSETVEDDLVEAMDLKCALAEILLIATPRQRELLEYLKHNSGASLTDAADATEMSRSAAKTQIARLRRQAEPTRAKYRKSPKKPRL